MRTAPPLDAAPGKLRFAYASCQHYESGYFTAYQRITNSKHLRVAMMGEHGLAWPWESLHIEALAWFDELRSGDEPNPLQWLNQFPPGHQPPPKSVHLDLRKANRAQLIASGVKAANVFVSDLCTACRPDLLFSYRKDGAESGRMMAAIGIRTD